MVGNASIKVLPHAGTYILSGRVIRDTGTICSIVCGPTRALLLGCTHRTNVGYRGKLSVLI